MVCLFIHRYRWGHLIRGDERGFLEKAAQYKARGLELLTVEKRPSMQGAYGDGLYKSLGTGEFRLPIRTVVDLAVVIMSSLIALGRSGKEKPAAVYAYNQDPENVVPGLVFKFLFGRPLVVVYHHITRLAAAPLGYGIAERRRTGYGLASSIWLSLVPAVNRKCLRLADLHLALSASTKSEAESWVGVRDCIVVGNGVDTKKFRELEVEKVYDAAFLGRIVPQKGVETLLRAWAMVVRRNPASRLVLVGGAEPNLMKHYRALAEQDGVADSVVFTGFLPDDELVRTLNSSKMFVFPSLKEGFAQAVSQAMACGLCCVLSDIPALRETYGEVAFLVPPGDPAALANMVTELLADERTLHEQGGRSREFVQRFEWGAVVEKELAAMRKSLSRG